MTISQRWSSFFDASKNWNDECYCQVSSVKYDFVTVSERGASLPCHYVDLTGASADETSLALVTEEHSTPVLSRLGSMSIRRSTRYTDHAVRGRGLLQWMGSQGSVSVKTKLNVFLRVSTPLSLSFLLDALSSVEQWNFNLHRFRRNLVDFRWLLASPSRPGPRLGGVMWPASTPRCLTRCQRRCSAPRPRYPAVLRVQREQMLRDLFECFADIPVLDGFQIQFAIPRAPFRIFERDKISVQGRAWPQQTAPARQSSSFTPSSRWHIPRTSWVLCLPESKPRAPIPDLLWWSQIDELRFKVFWIQMIKDLQTFNKKILSFDNNV